VHEILRECVVKRHNQNAGCQTLSMWITGVVVLGIKMGRYTEGVMAIYPRTLRAV